MAADLLITTRRNFLVRATGFIAALTPAAALVASKPDIPVITPEMVQAINSWRGAYSNFVATDVRRTNDRLGANGSYRGFLSERLGDLIGHERLPTDRASFEAAHEAEHHARMDLLRAIMGMPAVERVAYASMT